MAVTAAERNLLNYAVGLRSLVVPLARLMRQRVEGPFTATQLSMLGCIDRYGPISVTELAAKEQLSQPTVSKVLSVLEPSGLIEREVDASDRRVCRLRISRAGRDWLERGRADRNRWLAEGLARLAPDELAAIVGALPAFERLLAEREA